MAAVRTVGTSVLALDDLFQFHEKIWSEFLGLSERIVVGAYGALAIGSVCQFRRCFGRRPVSLLWLAVGNLGMSVLVDALFDRRSAVFVEDAFKFLGILFWASFFLISAVRDLKGQMKS